MRNDIQNMKKYSRNIYTRGINSVAQYMLNDKMIIILGENHRLNFDECKTPSIGTVEYIKKSAEKYDTLLLLEIPIGKVNFDDNYSSINLLNTTFET